MKKPHSQTAAVVVAVLAVVVVVVMFLLLVLEKFVLLAVVVLVERLLADSDQMKFPNKIEFTIIHRSPSTQAFRCKHIPDGQA